MLNRDDLLLQIAKKFGTPTYVFFPDVLRKNISSLIRAFSSRYEHFQLCYATKTNFLPEVIKEAAGAGAYPEVVPGIESDIISDLGLWGPNVVVNGSLKVEKDLKFFLYQKAMVNADNLTELEMLNDIGQNLGREIPCGVRVNIGSLGGTWSRFGFDIENGTALELLKEVRARLRYLKVQGVHYHAGTNNNDLEYYSRASAKISEWANYVNKQSLIDLEYINMGGGMASDCPLLDQEAWVNPTDEQYADAIINPILSTFKQRKPKLIIEPGRRLVDDSFIFLSKISRFITLRGNSVVLDGTTAMFPSAANRKHEIYKLLNDSKPLKEYTLYGASPSHRDIFCQRAVLPELSLGDVVVIKNAGAYSLNMSQAFTMYSPRVVLCDQEHYTELYGRGEYTALFSFPDKRLMCDNDEQVT